MNMFINKIPADQASAKKMKYELDRMMNLYQSAMKLIIAKLEILDSEFSIIYDHNPIHHIESRIKSIESIIRKAQSKGLSGDAKQIMDNVMDIAGVRVICNYIEDVYMLSDLLAQQNDVILIEKTDYIKAPKESGYRSLHLIVQIPVMLSQDTKNIHVEIQVRTIAMDLWASLEHEIRYKCATDKSQRIVDELKACSDTIYEADKKMQEIYHEALK